MVAEVLPWNRWDAWGRARGAFLEEEARGKRCPAPSAPPTHLLALPPAPKLPKRGSWGALSVPSSGPGVGQGRIRRRDLGTGMVLLAAFEPPREVSRDLLPARVPCPAVWGAGDSCECPPAPSPASGSPITGWTRWRWMVIEWKEWGRGTEPAGGQTGGGDRRQALGDPFPWPLEIVRDWPGRGMSDSLGLKSLLPIRVFASNSGLRICWGWGGGCVSLAVGGWGVGRDLP